MKYVITNGHHEIREIGDATGKTLKGMKGNITKMLRQRGFTPNRRKGHNGEWGRSRSNPHWVLRGRDVNYYRGKMGAYLCVYLIPDHVAGLVELKGERK